MISRNYNPKPVLIGLLRISLLFAAFYAGTRYPHLGNSANQPIAASEPLPVDPIYTVQNAPVDLAIKTLRQQRPDIHKEWIKRLKQKLPQDIASLRALLKSEHEDYRLMAADALGQIKNKDSIDDLILLVQKDPSDQVRYTAERTLAAIGDKRAIAHLIAALSDSDTTVRNVALDCLAALRAVQAIPAIEKFAKKYEYPSAQYGAQQALLLLRSLDHTARMFVGTPTSDQPWPYRYLVSRNGSNWYVGLLQQLEEPGDWTAVWGPATITNQGQDFVEFTHEWGVPGKSLHLAFRLDFPPTTTDTLDAVLTDKSGGQPIAIRFTRE